MHFLDFPKAPVGEVAVLLIVVSELVVADVQHGMSVIVLT